MVTAISCFFSSSPSSFQRNINLKLRLSLHRQRVAHWTIYDKDKSSQYIHGVPKLRGRHQKQHAWVPEKHDSISENIFPINKSCFHLSQNGGKSRLVPFCDLNRDNEVISSNSERTQNSASWMLGPAILVASFILPPLILPKVMLNNFGESSSLSN
ncbi:hypothetical protein DEO72_LG2g1376 [Vigna unguiculata]|uniref:Uncharacterized protein n=1 Tax=Vigna unguiculata TaxID=3917 RepID=A0A4D6KUC1_VIGUN|nr:hypothetical protein DEO72_LG2g1376 [Vigna unguiculata]